MQVNNVPSKEFSWGSVNYVYMSPYLTVKTLLFKKGGATSYHYHTKRQETLNVVSGTFKIITSEPTRDPNQKKRKEIVVVPGNVITIYPGEPHQIVALEDGILVEMCEEYSEYDTVRITI